MKRPRKTYQYFIIFLLTLMYSCEKEYTWKLKPVDSNQIVVDGILTNENKSQCIKLSRVNQEINFGSKPISGAIVTVTDNTKTISFVESTTLAGSYFSNPIQGVVGKTYKLKIQYNTDTLFAQATMVPLVTNDSFSISKENDLYKYNPIFGTDPVMIEIYYDWSNNQEYSLTYGSTQALVTFYRLNNVDVNKELGSEKETIYFPLGTKIIRKRYSLTDEHQAFLRSLLMETEWRGGIFDVQQGNVLTNISKGGLGYFGACTVTIDSLIVK